MFALNCWQALWLWVALEKPWFFLCLFSGLLTRPHPHGPWSALWGCSWVWWDPLSLMRWQQTHACLWYLPLVIRLFRSIVSSLSRLHTPASFSGAWSRVEECRPCCFPGLFWLHNDALSPGGVVCGSAENCPERVVSMLAVASRSTLHSSASISHLACIEQT